VTFTPPGGQGLASVTATTDAQGRYQALLVAGIIYTVSVALPPGFVGACTAGGNVNPTTLFTCGEGAPGQDRFTFAAGLAAGTWNDGITFVLVPSVSTAQPFNPNTPGIVRRLEGVIPGIFRNPDTGYTGVDVETIQVRVANAGVIRTGVQIEWYSTSSDDVASLVKTDTIDLNVGAVGIFTRSIIPDGCTRCMAEIYSIDVDQGGLAYGVSDLQATVSHRVVDADNAMAGSSSITFEDIFATGQTLNQSFVIPLVYKNYGGGAHKWNSVITACLTRGVPGAQPVVMTFVAVGETRGGTFNITRATNPGGCLVINLGTFDPDDPDYYDPIAGLPDGTFAVEITSTAGLPVPLAPERPGGFFATAISYTTTGKMAVMSNAQPPLGGEGIAGYRELYAPLLFKRYNDWNTGFVVSNFRSRFTTVTGGAASGGASSGFTLAMYGEDGTLFGVYLDRLSNSASRVYYMPTIPIQVPDGFRGTAIVTIGDQANASRVSIGAYHVNYERNQATSYTFIREDQLRGPASPFVRPCTTLVGSTTDPNVVQVFPGAQFNSCWTVADAQRRFGAAPRGTAATFEVGLGPTTGIRIFNPDVNKAGFPAYVLAAYTDASGVFYTDSHTPFTIPAFGTATIFMGADARLPDIFDGTVFIQSTQPLAVIGNLVDYRVVGRDASYGFNIGNQTGMTN
jgi:hypothetical protein